MAGKVFNSISEVLAHLEKNMVFNLEQIGEEIKGVLRHNVKQLWYERDFTPTHYDRTFELIESISVTKAKKVGGFWQVVIFFDTDKINPYPASGGKWSKHQSITNGRDVSHMIPYWTNYGQNSSIYSYEGAGFLEATLDWEKEDQYLKTRMIELLELKGYKCIG